MSAEAAQCPVMGGQHHRAMTNRDWWPGQLNLSVLRQNSELSNACKEFSSCSNIEKWEITVAMEQDSN